MDVLHVVLLALVVTVTAAMVWHEGLLALGFLTLKSEEECFRVERRFLNRRILRNPCWPHHLTIDLFEHVHKGFVFDGWRRNKFEFMHFFVS